jgi:hypothetical protein
MRIPRRPTHPLAHPEGDNAPKPQFAFFPREGPTASSRAALGRHDAGLFLSVAPDSEALRVLAWPRSRPPQLSKPGYLFKGGNSSQRTAASPLGVPGEPPNELLLGNPIQRLPSGFSPRPDAPAWPAHRRPDSRPCSSVHSFTSSCWPALDGCSSRRARHRTNPRQKGIVGPATVA